jgi:transcription initiation factor IIE alpha subunit
MNLQDQQSTAKGNSLVEKLVRTIARAFYTDSYVIVLEILIREKYLREEEFAPRLKLPEKDVNKVVRQLESEMLIRYEGEGLHNRMYQKQSIFYPLFSLFFEDIIAIPHVFNH